MVNPKRPDDSLVNPDDDVEGHRVLRADDDTDDVEGHVVDPRKIGGKAHGDDEDTEGHRVLR